MTWENVRLIFKREIRDQARDRRTLFSVIGLPVLLYPLMGLLILQVVQFRKSHPTQLRVIGMAEVPDSPALFVKVSSTDASDNGPSHYELAPWLLARADLDSSQFQIEASEATIPLDVVEENARETLDAEGLDAVLYFPAGFKSRSERFRQADADIEPTAGPSTSQQEFPSPQVFVDRKREKSRLAEGRLTYLLRLWRDEVIQENLEANDVPQAITNPFVLEEPKDLSEEYERRTALWSKIFPFIVVIWALTGAFYPAVDLCAGEKERGTLETLLSSPALRSEIVAGKLLAIMVFSVATSVLNMLSLGVTTGLVLGQAGSDFAQRVNFGPPPIWSLGWLLLALIPMAALFSALALAIAAMARSSKEGQYYLLPLLMVNLPLVVLPILPDSELSVGTSLIPVTGMLLLMRALMEGSYQTALSYMLPVLGVTAFCIWVSVRWAIDQFNNESVLFRESEHLNVRLWLRKTWRERGATPSAGGALLVGIVLLSLPYFLGSWIPFPDSAQDFVIHLLIVQIGMILLPVLLAGAIFTRSVRKTFILRWPGVKTLGAAGLLAVCAHPFALMLGQLIEDAIPMRPEQTAALEPLLASIQELPFWSILLLMAVLPAICEEFAFRGFILSGLRHLGHKWAAIAISAFFFGMLHSVIQQSISAAIVGLLIGFVAVQTRSLLPGVLYHMLHNGLNLSQSLVTQSFVDEHTWLRYLFQSTGDEAGQAAYHPILVGLCALGVLLLIRWFQALPAELSAEEIRRATLDHPTPYNPAKSSEPKP